MGISQRDIPGRGEKRWRATALQDAGAFAVAAQQQGAY